ncbi:hypothetical protein ACFLZ5_10885 [Thermodesulfobacteriota bacterium]
MRNLIPARTGIRRRPEMQILPEVPVTAEVRDDQNMRAGFSAQTEEG